MSSLGDHKKEVILEAMASGVVTAEQIAMRLGVSVRTIYRDIDALRRQGQPIIGEAGIGYMLRRREGHHVG